jgi:hypothetical protein
MKRWLMMRGVVVLAVMAVAVIAGAGGCDSGLAGICEGNADQVA